MEGLTIRENFKGADNQCKQENRRDWILKKQITHFSVASASFCGPVNKIYIMRWFLKYF